MKRITRGFTLIELLTVMAILLIVSGLLFTGIKYLGNTGKAGSTRTTLANLHNMLTEFESVDRYNRQPTINTGSTTATPVVSWWWQGGNDQINGAGFVSPSLGPKSPSTTSPPLNFWKVPWWSATFPQGEPVAAPVDVNPDVYDTDSGTSATWRWDRYRSDAVANTQLAIGVLMSVPANRQSLSNLPVNQRLSKPTGGPPIFKPAGKPYLTTTPASSAMGEISPPILADAWGNPIAFVPATGMRLMDTPGGNPSQDVSTGVIKVVRAKDHKPFFASAGPDGKFQGVTNSNNPTTRRDEVLAGAGDNIYSTEVEYVDPRSQ